MARAENWRLEKAGATRWGESVQANYDSYLEFLLKWNVIKSPVTAAQVTTNALLDEINTFDPAKVAADAKAYRYR
jgi:NitT/TauT family transport system substrate-binding protein